MLAGNSQLLILDSEGLPGKKDIALCLIATRQWQVMASTGAMETVTDDLLRNYIRSSNEKEPSSIS